MSRRNIAQRKVNTHRHFNDKKEMLQNNNLSEQEADLIELWRAYTKAMNEEILPICAQIQLFDDESGAIYNTNEGIEGEILEFNSLLAASIKIDALYERKGKA